MKKQDIHQYDDIISLPRPISQKHMPMSRENRAAQFAPFAALTGHKEAIQETERLTDERKVLDENRKVLLDTCLQEVVMRIKEHPIIKVTFFKEDEKKTGGAYLTLVKAVKRIDEYTHSLIFMDKSSLCIDDIYEMECIQAEEEIYTL